MFPELIFPLEGSENLFLGRFAGKPTVTTSLFLTHLRQKPQGDRGQRVSIRTDGLVSRRTEGFQTFIHSSLQTERGSLKHFRVQFGQSLSSVSFHPHVLWTSRLVVFEKFYFFFFSAFLTTIQTSQNT